METSEMVDVKTPQGTPSLVTQSVPESPRWLEVGGVLSLGQYHSLDQVFRRGRDMKLKHPHRSAKILDEMQRDTVTVPGTRWVSVSTLSLHCYAHWLAQPFRLDMWSTLQLQDCGVPVLDNYMKAMLGSALIFSGLLGAAVNGWLVATLFLRAEIMSWSHLLLLNIGIACLGRSLLGGFPFSATSALAGRWLFGDACCNLYAFLHQLFSVGELYSVMLLCLERYQVTCNFRMGQCAYISSILLSWIAAMIWSLLPLLNYGKYGCDVAGIACDLDWNVQSRDMQSWVYNLCYLFLGVLLSVIVSSGSLRKTVTSPESIYHLAGHRQQYITKATITLVCGMYILWLPQAIISLWRLGVASPKLNQSIVFMAPVCAEFSAVVPTLAFLANEPRLRSSLLGLPPEGDVAEDRPRMRRHRRRRRSGHSYSTPEFISSC